MAKKHRAKAKRKAVRHRSFRPSFEAHPIFFVGAALLIAVLIWSIFYTIMVSNQVPSYVPTISVPMVSVSPTATPTPMMKK